MEPLTETPFPIAPAPWTCKGVAFWFFCYTTPSKSRNQPLPPGTYEPLEGESPFAHNGAFKGGFGSVMVVRYNETPIGPYDELLLLPGYFKLPHSGKQRFRVTRIYVSTLESVYNGRRNWNFPKTLGVFEFNPAPPSSSISYSSIKVFSPDNTGHPFFCVNLTPMSFVPSIPFQSTLIPLNMTLVQPPLPEDEDWKRSGAVGTSQWKAVTPKMTGWIKPVWCEGGLQGGKWGNGQEFVEGSGLWSFGTYWKELMLEFGPDEFVNVEGKKAK